MAGEGTVAEGDRRSAGHGERLSSADAALLELERPAQPLHGGSLLVFDAPPADGRDGSGFARLLALVRARLARVPRYRQRLVTPPLGLGAPVWVDDPRFDLSYHVRHAALPAPGTTAQLTEYAARVLSRPLDRDRPLWELYVVEGLEQGRFALLAKSHHALVDGREGVDLTSVLLDRSPGEAATAPDEPLGPSEWEPAPTPTGAELARDAVRDLASSPGELVRAARRLTAAPARSALQALEVGRGVASVARRTLVRPAPRSLLNQPPGPHRRFAIQRLRLERVRTVKDTFGTTVHDVVLALVADATGRYLRSRGVGTDGLRLRAVVPVATREIGDATAVGDRVVPVLVDLPVYELDPVERLQVCADAMRDVRVSHQAAGAGFLTGLGEYAPPTIHALASRVAARSRRFNLSITNVPGPQEPVTVLGARLLGAFPYTPLTATQTYAVGVTSTHGWLNVGLTADADAVPDLERVTGWLVEGLTDLTRSADAVRVRDRPAGGPGDGTSG